MWDEEILNGKKLLVVDDEPDILETLEEFLDMCRIEKALDFETAKELLENNTYDAAILDIMGVRGDDLLKIAVQRKIPTIMLTAHALNVESFLQSMTTGADVFMPKDELPEIRFYVADVLRARQEKEKKPSKWFARLKPFFDRKFGPGWLADNARFWE